MDVTRANQVWAADITYIPLAIGFLYLVAILDWFSRAVLSWRLSTSRETEFCITALEEAFARWGQPDIFNTDQGVQFTSEDFTEILKAKGVRISMDGKRRCLDNVFVERLWPAKEGICRYFGFFNKERPHQALSYRTPMEVYAESIGRKRKAA